MDVANRYVSDFKKADKNGDSKLSQAEWTDACKQGWVHTSSSSGASEGGSGSSEKTSDRTPGDPSPSRTPGATGTGAAGTDAGQTPAVRQIVRPPSNNGFSGSNMRRSNPPPHYRVRV